MRSELGERIFQRIGEDGALEQLAEMLHAMSSTVRFMQRNPQRNKKDNEMTWHILAEEWVAVLISVEVLGVEENLDAVGGMLIRWAKALGIEVGDEGIKGPPGALGVDPQGDRRNNEH